MFVKLEDLGEEEYELERDGCGDEMFGVGKVLPSAPEQIAQNRPVRHKG